MLSRLWNALRTWDRNARRSFDGDLSKPGARWRAYLFFHVFDHAFLRWLWTNFDRVGDGVYRANQPGPRRVRAWANQGIKSILSLRGPSPQAFYALEKEAADELGMTFETVRLNAREASHKNQFLQLFEHFRTLPKPWVMHCKSGADRAGLASAIYVMWAGGTIEEARAHLSWRYMHLNNKNTGICDYILEAYDADRQETGIGIEEWFQTQYNRKALQKSYDAKVGRV
ncbi:tyrosine-protein phosphatase [Shimia ponticola]|uniref:tyrosine-protein phosphatase n=1 Tax=Shimia ponticola TaxID=2582893 RepID=UPI0011BE5A70|nr:tyrosine-protein phosphatase [Shimia ponticola]